MSTPEHRIYVEFLAQHGRDLNLYQQRIIHQLVEQIEPECVTRNGDYVTINIDKISLTTLKGVYRYVCNTVECLQFFIDEF